MFVEQPNAQRYIKYRPIAGFSFLGRYRLVDFAISNMSNSGIDDIQIYVNGNPRSLIDHVGTGRHYNINSKHGHLSLVPVYTDGGTSRFTTDISCYAENIHAVMENHNDYVVIAPANMLYKGNYEELLKQHIESGAEVSVLYQHVDNAKENYIGCDVLHACTLFFLWCWLFMWLARMVFGLSQIILK